MQADRVNSWFEWAGSVFVLISIGQVLHDRDVSGVNWLTLMFFAGWGYWNLYYYRAVQHFSSLLAAGVLAAVNTVYTGLLLYYG